MRGPRWWKCLACGACGEASDYETHFEIDVRGRGWCRAAKEARRWQTGSQMTFDATSK